MCDGLTNWDNVKPSIDLEALGKADELLLVDQVYTFQQILEYAYTVNLLHDGKAYDFLRNKISAARQQSNLPRLQKPLILKLSVHIYQWHVRASSLMFHLVTH